MKIIDRYILKELIKIFILSISVLTSVMFLDKMLYLTEMIVNKGVSIANVIKLLIFVSPAFLVLTIPMSVLVSSLITFNRLSADSELIVLNTSGYSFYRILRPVIVLSIAGYIITNFLMLYALPWGNYSFRNLVFNILRSRATIDIRERIFNNDFDNLLIYVNENDPNSNLMQGIFIADSRDKDNVQIVSAREGILAADSEAFNVAFLLKDGAIHNTDSESEKYRMLTFSTYKIQLSMRDQLAHNEKILKGNRDMSIKEIRKKIAYLKKNNMAYFSELVEFHKKFSIPFICLILGLVGAPLGIKSSRAGKSGGFAISLGVILFYYISLIAGESLGGAGKVYPAIAMWFPNSVILILGLYLSGKAQKV